MNELLRRLLMLPEQASSVAREVDQLHYVVIGVTFVGWAVLTLLGNYFLFRYRRRYEGQPTARVHPPLWIELGIAGGLLAMFIGWWVVGFLQFTRMREVPKDALEVYVTGKQWMWKFAYPSGRSDINELTVPIGRPVKLLMTSRDVIHSFYVPAFRLKQDVLPGRYVTLWFEATLQGEFEVFCTEYCGLWHSRMTSRVRVVSADEFDRWLEASDPVAADRASSASSAIGGPPATTPVSLDPSRTGSQNAMAKTGEQVALRYGCLGCHTLDGRPHIGPSFRAAFGRDVALVTGTLVRADESYLTRSMMDPAVEIVRGYQPVMPSYLGLLQPAEVGALVELIKSLRNPPAEAPLIPPWPGAPRD
jgi:cytochrome c oxidase subunit II